MNNTGLLTVIAVILLGIFTVILIEMNEETPAEQFSNSVSEVFEEVGDEIDDNTDAQQIYIHTYVNKARTKRAFLYPQDMHIKNNPPF